jgi:MFS transporter, putative metabolite:H+ symporter
MVVSQASIAARLDRLPISRFHYKLLTINGFAWAFDAFDVGLITFVVAALNKAWSLTPAQTGIVLSSGMFGMMLGAFLSGPLADRYGRKAIFQWTMLIFSVFSLLCAFAWNFYSLIVFRFFVGLGLGGETPVVTSLLGEFIPSSGRGRIHGLLNSFWAIGWLAAAAISYFIIPWLGWQWAFVAGALPAFFIWIVRRSMPESPRWLAVNGHLEKADAVVGYVEQQVAKTHSLPEIKEENIAMFEEKKVTTIALFSPQYLPRTIMLWALWFLGMFGYYGLFAWLPSLLVRGGHTMVQSFLYVLIMQIAYVPNQVISAYLMDHYGRKKLLVWNLFLATLATLAFGYALDHELTTVHVVILGIIVSFFVSGVWGITYMYTPELYPTGIRVTGTSWAATCSRLGSMLAPLIVGYSLSSLGISGVFSVVAAAFALAGVFVLTLGVETKGQALERINTTTASR